MASTDRALGFVSALLTASALVGVAAFLLLPSANSGRTPASKIALAAAASASHERAAVLAAPPEALAAPDVWSEAEQAATLRECLQLLAPLAVEVVVEPPLKRGQCGTPAPLAVSGFGAVQKVELSPAATMNCRLAAELAGWVDTVLQPAARDILGTHVTRLEGASSYSCRNAYNRPDMPLSQHATGAAIDIAGFVTADGRRIRVARAWGPTTRDIAEARKRELASMAGKASAPKTEKSKAGKQAEEVADSDHPTPSIEDAARRSRSGGQPLKASLESQKDRGEVRPSGEGVVVASTTPESQFLKRLHQGACDSFGTVLGPEANDAHRDHFHFDVKERKSHGVCQ